MSRQISVFSEAYCKSFGQETHGIFFLVQGETPLTLTPRVIETSMTRSGLHRGHVPNTYSNSLSIHFVSFLFLYPKIGKENSVSVWSVPDSLPHENPPPKKIMFSKHKTSTMERNTRNEHEHPFPCLNSFRENRSWWLSGISDRMDPATGCIAFRRWRGWKNLTVGATSLVSGSRV